MRVLQIQTPNTLFNLRPENGGAAIVAMGIYIEIHLPLRLLNIELIYNELMEYYNHI